MDKKTVIGGADGPTSIILLGHGRQGPGGTLKQKVQSKLFLLRKKRIAKSLKADPHTMDEVIERAKDRWGYTDIGRDSEEYETQYTQMRASFIMMYRPELQGELSERPKLEGQDEESLKRFMDLLAQRQKAAGEIPTELFDIDLCILERRNGESAFQLIFEKNYGYIGGSASGGSTREMKKYNREFRDIYRYYGVAQTDIDARTRRYEELLKTLARR